jgi:hypothetical protein
MFKKKTWDFYEHFMISTDFMLVIHGHPTMNGIPNIAIDYLVGG